MALDLLAQPVTAAMRTGPVLHPDDTVGRAALLLRETSSRVLPFIGWNGFAGVVDGASLARTLAAGYGASAPVEVAVRTGVPLVSMHASGAEALRVLAETGEAELLVVDDFGHIVGVVGAPDLVRRRDQVQLPTLVGGMATPFGVYLTSGGVRAGAKGWALVATGALLFGIYFVATLLSSWLAGVAMAASADTRFVLAIRDFLPVVLFLASLRLLPLSGIHAAEHKVVHALERGEPLEVEAVRRMPRIHPRCGTNVAVGLSLFMVLSNTPWVADPSLRTLAAAIVTLFLWRPLGNLFQKYITTRPPTDHQIGLGIRAGKELVETYLRVGPRYPTVGQRIVASGVLHVIAGSMLAYTLVATAILLFGLNVPL
ncbi:MAG: DUF1385 domain-containing protein [Fimbriimonadaceae bacterium]